MRTRFMMMAALVSASALTINAQTPQLSHRNRPQRPTEAARPTDDAQRRGLTPQVITVTGCLKEEKDVPGLKPNAAERAGVTEDYILTDGEDGAEQRGVRHRPRDAKYEIEGIAEAELQETSNHQVEITGSLSTGDAMESGSQCGGRQPDQRQPNFRNSRRPPQDGGRDVSGAQ